jgi:hypothetical protein
VGRLITGDGSRSRRACPLVGADTIASRPALDDVALAVLNLDQVVPGAAVELVLARAAGDRVASGAVVLDVGPGAAAQPVVAGAAVRLVVPEPPSRLSFPGSPKI